MKECRSCGVAKPYSEYYAAPRNKNGVTTNCKSCYKQIRKDYKIPTTYSPEQKMLKRSKSRALKKGFEHDITLADIHIPERCPLLGIPLMVGTDCATGNSPSLDRIDPRKGYVKGNVWVISNKANSIKNNATPEELIQIATRLADFIAAGLQAIPTSTLASAGPTITN